MELQNKFEEILNNSIKLGFKGMLHNKQDVVKQCTILCLEEQIELLIFILSETGSIDFTISNKYLSLNDLLNKLQQQLKLLKK